MIAHMELPFVDEHARDLDAPPAVVWQALGAVVAGSFGGARGAPGGRHAQLVRLLGCEPATRSLGATAPQLGDTFPGFRVTAADPGERLALEGRHRFASYRLVFLIDEPRPGVARLRAQTFAAFPGARGRAYRALVIGTRGHVLVVRRLLGAVARRAESAEQAAQAGAGSTS